jgi:hypothetical protein
VGTSERRPCDSWPSDRIGVSSRSSVPRRKATRRGEGGYFRRNHLAPVPNVASWEALNLFLVEASRNDEQRLIGERAQTVAAGMNLEREHLGALAEEGFDLAAIHFPHVNASGCAKVLTNFYSDPLPVGVEVLAKVHSSYVEIWHQGERVARHERFNRQQKVLNLEHYLEALAKKPGAFAGSTPLEQWRGQGRWPASFDRFWEMLKRRRGCQQPGTRAMIDGPAARLPAAATSAPFPVPRGRR